MKDRIMSMPVRHPACNCCLSGTPPPMALFVVEPTATLSGETIVERARVLICRDCLIEALEVLKHAD